MWVQKIRRELSLGFGEWAAFSCPISLVMLAATWAWLLFCFLGRDAFRFVSCSSRILYRLSESLNTDRSFNVLYSRSVL